MAENPIKVVHFHRKPELGCYSMERLFFDIRSAMSPDIDVTVKESSFFSRGLWRRVCNIVEAAFHQGEVNHIIGDVHFLTYLLNKKHTVLTIHDCGTLQSLSGIKRWILWLFWYWLPVRCSGTVTVISEASKQELLKHVSSDPKKLHVIYNCIPEWFSLDKRPFNSLRPRILHIGTTGNKNIERIAAALVGIKCCWVLIGRLSEAQRTTIESHGIEYENFFGLSDEALLEQYRLADMLVFASTYEGFGLPIVEANAVGRPVVTSNLLSMPEVAGDAACLVDPFDVGSIRAGIKKVIEDAAYRELLVERGLENAQRFQAKTIAEQYAALYRKIYADSNRDSGIPA